MTNCSFEGKVTAGGDGNNRAGGIAGYSQGGVVSGCRVQNALVTASISEGAVVSLYRSNDAGGIVGNSHLVTVIDCSFEGDVTASGNYQNIAGGIVGSSHKSEVSNCRSAGIITARDGKDVEKDGYNYRSGNIAGGVVGSFQTGEVTNCSFEGEATATRSNDNIAGGIAGYSHTSNVSNCYNVGSVSASGVENSNYAGGISGYGYKGTVSNCYNIGPVSASGGTYEYAGAIAGNNSENVANCYWLDSIATAGIGEGNINPINCSSFTAGQGHGTSRDFTYKITVNGDEEEKTGTLLDALNEWVDGSNAKNIGGDGSNGKTPLFLRWSQPHVSYNQGYPVLGDAPPAPAPDPVPSLTVPIRGGGQSISTPVSTSGTTMTIRAPYLPSLENVASAAAEAKESVLIDLSSLNDSYDTALIQQSILRTVTESAALGLALVMPDGKQVNFDQTGLSFFEKIGSGDLKLSVRTVAADEISREQRNIIGSAPVYELSVFVGEKKVTDFGGGLAEVTIPVVGGPVADPVVWRMAFDARGEVDLKALPCSYDAGTNSYGFETTGFSLYVIGDYPFVDTADSAWYYEDTVFAYGRGLFQGTTRTTFAPLQDMKRCQLVTVLWRLEGKPLASGKGFSDVTGGEYFADALAWASANEIILGYENGDFGPYDSITRQQFALVMYRYAKYKGYDVEKGAGFDLAAFEDEDDVSSFALGAVRWLCGNDVIRGNNGRILPHKSASRAEVAAMLRRFSESVVVP